MAGARSVKPGRLMRERHHQRQGDRLRRHLFCVVQRTDRRPDHEAQARQAPDVRTRQARPSASPCHWRSLKPSAIKNASEPLLDPSTAQNIGDCDANRLRDPHALITLFPASPDDLKARPKATPVAIRISPARRLTPGGCPETAHYTGDGVFAVSGKVINRRSQFRLEML
jgi:hypothetical protein